MGRVDHWPLAIVDHPNFRGGGRPRYPLALSWRSRVRASIPSFRSPDAAGAGHNVPLAIYPVRGGWRENYSGGNRMSELFGRYAASFRLGRATRLTRWSRPFLITSRARLATLSARSQPRGPRAPGAALREISG